MDTDTGYIIALLDRKDFRSRSAVAVGGRIYIVGETTTRSWLGWIAGAQDVCMACVVYEAESNTWTDIAVPWIVSNPCGVVAVGTRIYIMRTRDAHDIPYMLSFETTSGAWTRQSSLMHALPAVHAVAVSGRIYVTGGHAIHGDTLCFNVYDTVSAAWTNAIPTPFLATDVVIVGAVGCKIWCIKTGYCDPESGHVVATMLGQPFVVFDTGTGIWVVDCRGDHYGSTAMTTVETTIITIADGRLFTYDTTTGVGVYGGGHRHAIALLTI
ncbi:MAG: hypothetical protein WC732_08770 [Candidatus Omnitrophota bacterium]